ncbi:MAG: transcriptional activator RfaH [Paracoccaceae bacterium]|nr:transcriptional activator RfaH [Paracoccaceae bacterium]MDE3121919.1 transcriptional activator RfaH [Paracoccaceae bacterium]MDE3238387.1 transcriptional activator RfaH [Paracoccaceae bacterium]
MQLAPDAPWYAAQLRPNGLNMALRGLARQGFELFLPKIRSNPKRVAGTVLPWVPLFPGYLFVRFDPERPAWRAINSTRGVTRLLGHAETGPRPVPAGLVEALQLRCNENGLLTTVEDLAPGDRVRLLTGPFSDLVAEIEAIAPDRRIWLLLDLMGRKTRVGVRIEDLARIG